MCTRLHVYKPTRPLGAEALKAPPGLVKAIFAMCLIAFVTTLSAQTTQHLIFGNDSGCNLRVCPWIDDENGDCSEPTYLDCWSVPNGSTLQTEFTIPAGSILCYYTAQEEGVYPTPILVLPCGDPIHGSGFLLCDGEPVEWKMSDCGNIRILEEP